MSKAKKDRGSVELMADDQGAERPDQTETAKVVMVQVAGKKIMDRDPYFLFSTNQVEEVLSEIYKRPLPFSPEYLLGVCLWQQRLLPIIDLGRRCGFFADNESGNSRYLVVRAVVPMEIGDNLQRCIMKVSSRIITAEIPDVCSPVALETAGVELSNIRGLFECDEKLMMVPDLTSILTC